MVSLYRVFITALKLGLTSFGGPIAHLGYFREEYVSKRRWIDEGTYADIVALCHFLPGPTSSQVGIAIGLTRRGILGAVGAWLGFTLPSAAAMLLFAYGTVHFQDLITAEWLRGLKAVAVAVVAIALWGMAKSLAPDRARASIAIITAIAMLFLQHPLSYLLAIIVAGVIGWRFVKTGNDLFSSKEYSALTTIRPIISFGCIAIFLALLLGLPLAANAIDNNWLNLFDGLYRSGSLVFGGGHVVLPLLQTESVQSGWVSTDQFIAGYGAVQAVPGPLFTFAAYLGGIAEGWSGALIAIIAIFLPSFLLVIGIIPFWSRIRSIPTLHGAFASINAAVVGFLAAALYDPVWTAAIHTASDFALALAAFGLLAFWKAPPWLVVLSVSSVGVALARL